MENAIGYGTPHRKKHEQQEEWVGAWLDCYFYPYITKNFARNTDTYTQKKGIDLTITGSTKIITVDEKAAVEWCNTGLNKSSLELSLMVIDKQTGDKKEINGWYLSNSISTHIALVWIDSATTVSDRYLDGSGITQATITIIDKEYLQACLDDEGWTKTNLKKKAKRVRDAFDTYGNDYWKYENCGKLSNTCPHFFIQEKTKEHGVSIQFTQNWLVSVSDYAAIITKDKITELHRRN